MSSDPLPSSQSRYSLVVEYHTTALAGLLFGALTLFLHFILHNPYLSIVAAGVSIVLLSLTVSDVAEVLAERLEEPYGSFVLTFTAVVVEIMLLFMVLLTATGESTTAMETVKGGIISAVIVDMNVLLGLAVFIGGLAFKEQEHNEDTSSTYTTILLVASSALLVPSILHFTNRSAEDLMLSSIIIACVLFVFYIIIFIFQTKTHSHFFKATARSRIFRYKRKLGNEDEEEEVIDLFDTLSTPANFAIVFMLIAVIGVIAEIFASDGMQLVFEYSIPVGLAGLVIAIVSVAPEIATSIKAAKNDQIQRVVNIAMGASTVSIMLAVPILMALSFVAGNPLTLDFNTLQIGALILTVVLAWKTTDDGETNYFEGTSHLIFFICYAIIAAFH